MVYRTSEVLDTFRVMNMVYRSADHFTESHVTFFENIQSRRCFDETAYVVPRIDAVWEEDISGFKDTGTCAVFSMSSYII